MSMADAQFRQQVEADAVRAGWPADVAALLAAHVGRPQRTDAPRPPRQHRAFVGHAPAPTLDQALTWFGLPTALAADFRAAGMPTVAAAGPLLTRYLAATARRSPAAAASALTMNLLTRRTYGKKANA